MGESSGSAFQEDLAIKPEQNSSACRIDIFLDIFTTFGLNACNTLLAVTIFLSVRFLIQVEQYRWANFAYIVFALGWPGILAISFAAGLDIQVTTGLCEVSGLGGHVVLRLFFFLFLGIQLFLYAYSFWHLRKAIRRVDSNSFFRFNDSLSYLTIRFAATFLAQVWQLVPFQAEKSLENPLYPARFVRFAIIACGTGPILAALIIVFGNTEFLAWTRRRMLPSFLYYCRLRSRHSSPSITPIGIETHSAVEPTYSFGPEDLGVKAF